MKTYLNESILVFNSPMQFSYQNIYNSIVYAVYNVVGTHTHSFKNISVHRDYHFTLYLSRSGFRGPRVKEKYRAVSSF